MKCVLVGVLIKFLSKFLSNKKKKGKTSLVNWSLKVFLPFSATYLCKSVFSTLTAWARLQLQPFKQKIAILGAFETFTESRITLICTRLWTASSIFNFFLILLLAHQIFSSCIYVCVCVCRWMYVYLHFIKLLKYYISNGAMRWRSWLRHCATSRKVAGSIPDGVGIFHWHNPSGRTVALGSAQPPTEMSIRNISWG